MYPFGNAIGSLSSFIILPLILQTMHELSWWAFGNSFAIVLNLSEHTGQLIFLSSSLKQHVF